MRPNYKVRGSGGKLFDTDINGTMNGQLLERFKIIAVLSKYFRVLSDIGLTEFQILSDRTKFCRTKLFIKPIVKLCSVLFSIT